MMNEEPLAWEIEVVICSPMRRTVQTMVEGLACVLSGEGGLMGEGRREVKVEFDADWQGRFGFFFSASLVSLTLS
jgi:hypothetical protein